MARFVRKVASVVLAMSVIGAASALPACGEGGSDMDAIREAQIGAMTDDEMKREYVLLGRKIDELKANPKALPERIAMLEKSRSDFADRLGKRGIDPASIDAEAILSELEDD